MLLHVGFVAKAALIAHPWFGCCWAVLAQHPGLLSFITVCKRGWARDREDAASTANMGWPKGQNVLLSSKNQEWRSKRSGTFLRHWLAFNLLVGCTASLVLRFSLWPSVIKPSYFGLQVVLLLLFLFSFLPHCGEWSQGCGCSAAGQGESTTGLMQFYDKHSIHQCNSDCWGDNQQIPLSWEQVLWSLKKKQNFTHLKPRRKA